MQDEGSAKGFEATFQKHWEKLAIGVVLIAAIALLGPKLAAGTPAEEAAVDQIVVAKTKAENDRNPNIPSPSSFKKSSDSAQVTAFKPLPFTGSVKTRFKAETELVAADKVDFVIPSVKLESATASFEGVDLAWTLTEVKPDPTVKGQHVVDPKTFYFQVERRVKGEPWKVIASKLRSKDGKDLNYRDSQTQPRTEYEYRVTLGSDEKKWTDKNPKGLVSRPSETLAARTSSIYAFKFDNYQRFDEEDPPKPATVYITITKHDPVAGRVEVRYTHTEGDKIGWKKDDKGPTSKHRVFSTKLRRNVEVDFNSGAVLKKIAVGKLVTYKYKECQKKATPDGMVCEGPKEVEGKYYANEVTYLDEEGNVVNDPRPTGSGPKEDQLCEEHGGAPPPVVRDEKPAPDREEAAMKLLQEAEKLWGTEKAAEKKKAQKIYKELLDKYGDTEAMKFRKDQVQARIKEAIK